jgi:two-component system, LuxR family, sensor kinase FixL
MEHQLSHVSRLSTMGEMVAGIAHEVNQPLYSIVNYAKACANLLAKGGNIDLQQVSTWTDKIANAATRAGKIVSRMREFVSRRTAENEPVRIDETVSEAVELLAFDLRHSGAVLTSSIPLQLPEIHGDRVQLQQVLVNLVRNAVEAVSDNADGERKVAIEVEVEEESLRVSVLDNGPGPPSSDEVALFEPFETTKSDGLGMGLAISRTIIENHGGKLWAESNPEGGAAFRFTLPLPLPTRQNHAG